MPKQMEEALKRQAHKMVKEGKLKKIGSSKTTKQAEDAFVYGTMRKTGWKPSTQKA